MSEDTEEKEEMEEAEEKGMKDEGKEHPSIPEKTVKTIVKDHLKMDDDYYDHETGYGGGGGSPVKFLKREGRADDKRIIDGKGIKSNFD